MRGERRLSKMAMESTKDVKTLEPCQAEQAVMTLSAEGAAVQATPSVCDYNESRLQCKHVTAAQQRGGGGGDD